MMKGRRRRGEDHQLLLKDRTEVAVVIIRYSRLKVSMFFRCDVEKKSRLRLNKDIMFFRYDVSRK